jgi:hypothetical protein
MRRAFLPFLFLPSAAVLSELGAASAQAAVLAIKAICRHRRSLEVAHQQIEFRGKPYVFSSRITGNGDLVLNLDIGDERLADRIVLEEELRQAHRNLKGIAPPGRAGRRGVGR